MASTERKTLLAEDVKGIKEGRQREGEERKRKEDQELRTRM